METLKLIARIILSFVIFPLLLSVSALATCLISVTFYIPAVVFYAVRPGDNKEEIKELVGYIFWILTAPFTSTWEFITVGTLSELGW